MPVPNDETEAALPARGPARHGARTVLVADDSAVQRRILRATLSRWGYSVLEAGSGFDALATCRERHVDIVLSDWMMPGMDGLEFCAAFRALEREGYGYFILLTSKREKDEIAQGLEVGADDFLTKPVNGDELHARLIAGERVLRMESALTDRNRQLTSALGELRLLYDTLDRDLEEARKLQQSLVRERHREFGAATVSLALRPSGHVGGDLVGQFAVNEGQVGIYGLDVSGHGIASALMAARLAGHFSGAAPERNLALETAPDGSCRARPPEEVAETLNRLVIRELDTEHYFTLLLGLVDLATGRIAFVQAGHPHPLLLRRSGDVEIVGRGGFPVGLIEDASYERAEAVLAPGDRLLIPSDGMTECAAPDGRLLGEQGLAAALRRHRRSRGGKLLDALLAELEAHAKGGEFEDDVSAVLVEFSGKGGGENAP